MTDKEKILNPDRWPFWPKLPMIRHDQKPNVGIIYGDPSNGEVMFVPGANVFSVTGIQIAKDGVKVNIDELLAQGWKVD
jgi:hypothetical protein